jgi:CRP-like cAMP-binding protein
MNRDNTQLVLKKIGNTPATLINQKELFFDVGEDPLNSVDTAKYFYFVLDGKIKIYDLNIDTAKEQTLYILTRGDMFDVVSLLDSNPNQYISEVLEATHLVQVPLADVRNMIDKDNEFKQYFYAYLASKLKSMENLAVSLSVYDVYQRVVQLFAKFTKVDINGKPKLHIIDNLKHDDIASMVGSVRKVVNRTLQSLKKDGIIEISRKKIIVKNFQNLLDKLDI